MIRELVISAYDKDYSWVSALDPEIKITVYRKGNEPKQREDEILITPNKGRCVHSFFNHIYTNYDNLADYTFFVQDYPFDHWENLIYVISQDSPEIYELNSQLTIGGYYGFHFNTITVPSSKGGIMWKLSDSTHHGSGKVLICNSNGSPQDTNPNINVDKYWNLFFESSPPSQYEFMPGGHFGITKEHAQLRSKSFYKQIIDLLLQEDHAPWIIERLECYIFNPIIK
jgi:hypothetical protein